MPKYARSPKIGPLLETFVLQEVRKQLSWSSLRIVPYHFRTSAGREVDIALEEAGGKIAGIEVKATAKVGPGDFRGLRELAAATGRKFVCGVLLSLAENVTPFADNLWSIPVSELWAKPAARSKARPS